MWGIAMRQRKLVLILLGMALLGGAVVVGFTRKNANPAPSDLSIPAQNYSPATAPPEGRVTTTPSPYGTELTEAPPPEPPPSADVIQPEAVEPVPAAAVA